MTKGINFILVSISLFVCIQAVAQENNPLDKIRFYSTSDLDWNTIFNTDNNRYNKQYDPEEFFSNFFAPWTISGTQKAQEVKADPSFLKHFDAYKRLTSYTCHGGNYRAYTEQEIQQLLENTQTDAFPNRITIAITINTTNIRRLPTNEFCLQDIRNAGEGYPFDYFQESSLWMGTPLLILQESKDHLWHFVISPYGKGWIKTQDLALLSRSQAEDLMKRPWGAIIQEKVILKNEYGYSEQRIGTILPLLKQNRSELVLLVPYRKPDGQLILKATSAQNQEAQLMPLTFNKVNTQKVMTGLYGSKYGWGGIDQGRDCSSTIKDFFTPFGIWLPRNSRAQKEIGQKVEIVGNPSEKMQQIAQHAIPFFTILYKPGHSMLYIGTNSKGTPLIFHNVWGIKPILKDAALEDVVSRRDDLGLFGINKKAGGITARYIIGQACITSTNPEEGFYGIEFDSFMKNMESMNFIKN